MIKVLLLVLCVSLLFPACNKANDDRSVKDEAKEEAKAVPLSPSDQVLKQKAAAIHDRVLTVDTHTDTPMRLHHEEGFDLGKRNDPHNKGGKVDYPRMKEGGLDAVFFAVFQNQGKCDAESYERIKQNSLEVFDLIHQSIKANADTVELALTADDAYSIEKKGKRAVYIGIENGYIVGEDLSLVEKYYNLGARYITISHSRNNQLCDSSTDKDGPRHNGLSEFGKQVIAEMNRLGMMIDVSHISDKSFFDIMEITKAPVMASHSCARALSDNPRNLSDDLLKALAKNNGVIQVCIFTPYVKQQPPHPERDAADAQWETKYPDYDSLPKDEKKKASDEWWAIRKKFPMDLATVSDVVDHIDYIVKLIGIDYVGIGTDFDGGGSLKDCNDVSEMGNITLELVKRGYSEEDIRKIWGGNVMRVFRDVEKLKQ